MSEVATVENKPKKKIKVGKLIALAIVGVIVIAIAITAIVLATQKSGLRFTEVEGGYEVSYFHAVMDNDTSDIDIEIPAEHEGKPVVSIANRAFLGMSRTLKSVTIPASVTRIGEGAFQDRHDLEYVVFELGSQLKEIGKEAFRTCQALKGINLPDTVEKIGNAAFMECAELQSFEIPENVTVIESSTFSFCGKLVTVEGSGITKISDYAFSNCYKLEQIDLLQCVKGAEISDTAFYNCTKVKGAVLQTWLDKWK